MSSSTKEVLGMPNPRVSAALFLTFAGAAGAAPNCPQLVSAEPPALVSYLDDAEKSQTPACIEYAIRQIGDKVYVPAVDTLVRHLGFRREPEPWEREHGGAVIDLMHEWYPATIALYQIGKPALPALLDVLATDTIPVVRQKALQTVMDISSNEDIVSGVKVIRDAAATRRDKAAQARLLDAARKSVLLCRPSIRPRCEAALR
jgi:hypothetical protein